MTQPSMATSAEVTTDQAADSKSPRSVIFQQEKLEPILVVITAVAIAASLIAERVNAPEWLILAINITSYVAGGWFGLQAGLKSLVEREINVDLLMVLAAAGAAVVNQWHEGAILLFLFSLSNVLQAYAMDRSRNAIKALRNAISDADAALIKELLPKTVSVIDNSVHRGILPRNSGARYKSHLTTQANRIVQAADKA